MEIRCGNFQSPPLTVTRVSGDLPIVPWIGRRSVGEEERTGLACHWPTDFRPADARSLLCPPPCYSTILEHLDFGLRPAPRRRPPHVRPKILSLRSRSGRWASRRRRIRSLAAALCAASLAFQHSAQYSGHRPFPSTLFLCGCRSTTITSPQVRQGPLYKILGRRLGPWI